MMRFVTFLLIAGSIMLVTLIVPNATTAQLDPKGNACSGATFGGTECNASDFRNGVKKIVNIISYIVGTVAIIAAIASGIMYAASGGDPQNTKRAKDALLFAIVGVVVALFAFAMANFVVTSVGAPPSTTPAPAD